MCEGSPERLKWLSESVAKTSRLGDGECVNFDNPNGKKRKNCLRDFGFRKRSMREVPCGYITTEYVV